MALSAQDLAVAALPYRPTAFLPDMFAEASVTDWAPAGIKRAPARLTAAARAYLLAVNAQLCREDAGERVLDF